MDKLTSDSPNARESALSQLAERQPADILPAICDLLLRDVSPATQTACLDLAERLGGSVSLSEIRTDGWLARLGRQIGSFDAVSAIIGQRFLAYAIILGVQIRTLTRDPTTPANTMVEFSTGDNLQQVLPLGEFRSQVVRAMLQIPDDTEKSCALPLDTSMVEQLIGQVTLLLSPLFDYSLRFIVVRPSGDTLDGIVGVLSPTGFGFFPIKAFRETIRLKLARDEAGTREEPFRLDLTAIEAAREARDEGDNEKLIAHLDTWPGLLSTLLKTPIARSLSDSQLSVIAEGLLLLGDAFRATDRLTWSEELYRLGLQYVKALPIAGPLFGRLGHLLMEQERFGEAIGYLRRALALGDDAPHMRADLAHCLLKQGRVIGASLLLKDLSDAGCTSDRITADISEIISRLEANHLSWPILKRN